MTAFYVRVFLARTNSSHSHHHYLESIPSDPAVQVRSVYFVLDTAYFSTFSALADLLVPGGLVLEVRFLLFQVNYAWKMSKICMDHAKGFTGGLIECPNSAIHRSHEAILPATWEATRRSVFSMTILPTSISPIKNEPRLIARST